MGEILGHLGDDLGFGFLCKLAPEIAENFRRRHDHKLVERAGQGNFIDPVCDRSSETFLFEFVPVRLSNGAANLADAGIRPALERRCPVRMTGRPCAPRPPGGANWEIFRLPR